MTLAGNLIPTAPVSNAGNIEYRSVKDSAMAERLFKEANRRVDNFNQEKPPYISSTPDPEGMAGSDVLHGELTGLGRPRGEPPARAANVAGRSPRQPMVPANVHPADAGKRGVEAVHRCGPRNLHLRPVKLPRCKPESQPARHRLDQEGEIARKLGGHRSRLAAASGTRARLHSMDAAERRAPSRGYRHILHLHEGVRVGGESPIMSGVDRNEANIRAMTTLWLTDAAGPSAAKEFLEEVRPGAFPIPRHLA